MSRFASMVSRCLSNSLLPMPRPKLSCTSPMVMTMVGRRPSLPMAILGPGLGQSAASLGCDRVGQRRIVLRDCPLLYCGGQSHLP